MKRILIFLLLLSMGLQLGAQVREPHEKQIYKTTDEGEFAAEIYYPSGVQKGDKRPAFIFYFGGGWMSGVPRQFYSYCHYFSTQGFVAITGDYRVGSKHNTSPFDAVEDAKSLVRWVRANAAELGVDPDRIVVAGGSAGGHLALCTDLIDGYECASEDLSISSRPNYVVGFNPVMDTTPEGYGYDKVKPRDRDISPVHNVKPGCAPMLLLHGTKDSTVPYANAVALNREMKRAGNRCTLISYWGSNHGFFNDSLFSSDNTNHRFSDVLYQIALFLKREGFDIDPKRVYREDIRVAIVGDLDESYAGTLESLVGDNYRFNIFSAGDSESLSLYQPDILVTTSEITSSAYDHVLDVVAALKARPTCHLVHASSESVDGALKQLQAMKIKISSTPLEGIDSDPERFALDTYNAIAQRRRSYISDDIAKIESIDGVISPALYHQNRGGLANSYKRFTETKKGRVAFLGGSITFNDGWRNYICDYLERRFPDTEFTFTAAGIPSEGSTSGAFRLDRDILSKGDVDLLFIESAVNDRSEAIGRIPIDRVRGAEGIVRHAKSRDIDMDIVAMYFVDPDKMRDYRSGKTPQELIDLDQVSDHYNIPSINLAKEVTDRIDAGEFTWEDDFINLHPSPFGQKVYYRSMHYLLESCFADAEASGKPSKYKMPRLIDQSSYTDGEFIAIADQKLAKGWTRKSYQATRAMEDVIEASFGSEPIEFSFKGRVVGLRVISGSDSGMIEYSIDGGEYICKDQFTSNSNVITLPRYTILATGLDPKKEHTIKIRPSKERNAKSKGTYCRITDFMVSH